MASVLDVPAVLVNRVTINVTKEGLRVIFGESPDGTDKGEITRAAVFMPMPIAEQTRNLFNNMFDKILPQLEQGVKPPTKN